MIIIPSLAEESSSFEKYFFPVVLLLALTVSLAYKKRPAKSAVYPRV